VPELGLTLSLLTDAVFSLRAGTGAGHETLPMIPGAALLGCAAGRMYTDLETRDALAVFHSGRVRFGWLRPSASGRPSYPVPLSWHHAKGDKSFVRGGRFEGTRLVNLAAPQTKSSALGGRQPVPIKRGFVTQAGEWLRPQRRVHLKSARDRTQRRTREGALFSYESLCAGQTFMGTLSWSDDVSQPLIERVTAALAGERRLGRSRSAEFGRVAITRAEALPLPRLEASENELRVLCASDLALSNALGAPTLRPSAEAFGIEGRWLPERSFLRTRSYAPFNGKRRAPDLERHVIVAGSVLVFHLDKALSQADLEQLTLRRHGLHTLDGLGEILANPAFLMGSAPTFEKAPQEATPKVSSLPDHPLARWAERSVASRRGADDAVAQGKALTRSLRRAWEALEPALRPGASQWRLLALRAQAAQDLAEFGKAIDEVTDHGVAQEAWQARVWADGRTTLRERLLGGLNQPQLATRAGALTYACRELARHAAAQEVSA
jgi:CRISPR-associated protein Csx10